MKRKRLLAWFIASVVALVVTTASLHAYDVPIAMDGPLGYSLFLWLNYVPNFISGTFWSPPLDDAWMMDAVIYFLQCMALFALIDWISRKVGRGLEAEAPADRPKAVERTIYR